MTREEEFKIFLKGEENAQGLVVGSKKYADGTIMSYLRAIKADVVNRYVKQKSNTADSIFDINNIEDLEYIREQVTKDKDNDDAHRSPSAAVGAYIKYVEASANKLNVNNVLNPTVIVAQSSARNTFSIKRIIDLISETGLLYEPALIKRFAFSLMSKRFLILSGLAGSGKTQLALAFAETLIADDSQLCVVPVGADWTNREPLLGYRNALAKDDYVMPETGVLNLLIEANKPENADKPYFLILDEMNMSYVERYFADFLSAMESNKPIRLWNQERNVACNSIQTDSNISSKTVSIVPNDICLPDNLFIIGTINVDETTYMFSPKVLDRANVIEFKVSEGEMDQFLNEMRPVDRSELIYKEAASGKDFIAKSKGKEMISADAVNDVLVKFFKSLKEVNAEFGFRSASEMGRFIYHAINHDDTRKVFSNFNEVIDWAIVQKMLPKIHGSRKKLDATFRALWKECFENSVEHLNIAKEAVQYAKYPISADKIRRMYETALTNGFTSFSEA